MSRKPIEPPTPLARQFVRMVVGFSAGIAVGVAPFLGTVDVPLFEQLVDLFPDEGRNRLFGLGAFLMGVVAVAIQFYAAERVSRQRLRRLFAGTLVVILLALALLAVLVEKFVVQVDTNEGVATFLLAGERLAYPECPCPDKGDNRLGDRFCLQMLGADPVEIERCWSPQRAENPALALTGSYLLLTGGFGALIGLLLLQRAAGQQEAKRRKPRREAAVRRAQPTDVPPVKPAKKRTRPPTAAKPASRGSQSKRSAKPAPARTEDES